MERTLLIIKPDGVQRGLIGEILSRLERRGLKIVGMKMIRMDESLARRHYGVHEGKPFFDRLIRYIVSSPVVVMVAEGRKAVDVVRKTMGATDPTQAEPGTIRADYAMEINFNLLHGSDGPETAKQEIELFFHPSELHSWERGTDRWLYE